MATAAGRRVVRPPREGKTPPPLAALFSSESEISLADIRKPRKLPPAEWVGGFARPFAERDCGKRGAILHQQLDKMRL